MGCTDIHMYGIYWIIVRTVLYSKVNDGSVEYVHSFFFDGVTDVQYDDDDDHDPSDDDNNNSLVHSGGGLPHNRGQLMADVDIVSTVQ